MKQALLIRLGVLTTLSLVLFCNILSAQITKSTFTFEAPKVLNLHQLSEFEKDHPVILKKRFIEQGEDREKFIFKPKPVSKNARLHQLQEVTKKAANQVAKNSPAASQNFQGVLDNGTLIPPDINGVAGMNYIIETTNQQFNIYNKSSGSLSNTVSITSLFAPSGLFNYYDPHVTYDPNNDRFIIGIDAQTGSSSSSPSAFGLAISQTGDPTGNWYIYKVVTTPNAPTDFMDYDELGFNNNWVVMTGNDFPAVGGNKSYIYVWPRATLYSGGSGTATTFSDANNLLISPATTYDASENTLFMVSDYNGNSGGNGYINIGTITGTASSPVYTPGNQLGINKPWQEPSNLVQAPESGESASNGLEAGDTRISSVIYRNGSLWFTHAIFLPASGTITNSGVDWWQINPADLTVTQFDRIADANSKIWYFYPSLNVNATNDMLVGYSSSSATTFAGAQYALHLSSDPANTVQTPIQYVNGLAGYYKTYGGGRNRWGDYSGTAFDPVDNSFWTFQEWPNTGSNWGTQIAHVPITGVPVCNTPTGTATSNITNTSANFGWGAVTGAASYNVQYRVIGTTTWTSANIATNSYNATSLTAGTTYEWQVQTVCSGTSSSAFTVSTNFTTTGACNVPASLTTSSITNTSAIFGWAAVTGAASYNVHYRVVGTTTWTSANTATNSYNATDLTAGTNYEWQVQTVCSGTSSSAFTVSTNFTTTGGCNVPASLTTSSITNTSAIFGWAAVTGGTSYNVHYRVVGTTTWTSATSATNSYNATVLTAGTNYEWQVQTVCSVSSTSAYSASSNFTTTGGCSVPSGLAASSITTTTAKVSWTAVTGATSYNLQYKISTAGSFTTVSNLTGTSYNLTGLTAASTYQYQVQAICSSGSSAYSSPASFQTSSGTLTYCASNGNTTYEYLKTVALGTINHTVTNDGGYGNYTNLSTNLTAGTAYTIKLTPGFTGSSYREYYSVFIDYNQDGVLNGTGELVATGNGTRTGAKSLTFTVPTTAKNGPTRIRIQLQYGSASTNPCATLTYGDVHDYTVNIQGGASPLFVSSDGSAVIQKEVLQNSLSVIPNPLTGKASATALYNLAKNGNTTLKVIDLAGRTLYTVNLGVQNAGQHNYLLNNVTNNLHSGYYLVVLVQNSKVVSSNRLIVGK